MLRSCTRIKHLDLSETLAGDKTLNLIHQLSLPPPFPPLWLRQAADADACEPRLSLSHLNLSWTRVTNSGCADSLSALTSLSHLNLDSGSLTDHALASLPPSLTSLLCFSLRCHDAPGASLISKASQLLQRLELCGGFLGDDGLLEVGKLTHLTNLNISQNPRITDKGIVNLLGTSFPPNSHRSSPLDHDSSTSSSLSSSSSSSESNEVKPRSRGIFALKDLALAGTRVTLSKTNQYGQEAMSLLLGLEHLSSLCLSNTAVSREDVELFCHERKRYESAPSSRQHCVVKWEALPH